MQAGLGLLCALLVWQIATRSLPAFLAQSHPHAALALRATASEPQLELAAKAAGALLDDSVQLMDVGAAKAAEAAGLTPSVQATAAPLASNEQIRAWAAGAVASAPLSARGLAILGALDAQAGDVNSAERFMSAAAARSLRERAAVAWMMNQRFHAQDYDAALRFADALARSSPQSVQIILPYLGHMAENPKSSARFTELMKRNPPWRATFFDHLSGNITDARTPLSLLFALKNTKTPPTQNELKAYSSLLMQNKQYDLAYNAWLQFLSPEQLAKAGFLFNGGFDFELSPFVFDWTPARGKGLLIDRVGRMENAGGMALMIEFGGARIDPVLLTQTLMLPAGDYQFEGKYRGDARVRRGLSWSVRCLGQSATINAPSDPRFGGQQPGWTPFSFTLSVPATDCRAQLVQLQLNAHSPSDTMATGRLYLSELKIIRQRVAGASEGSQAQ
ncbi:MAG: hypothetical protein JNL45_13025 [Hyphomicrobium sp.]|nr:hypothetical protein [Hyphomicrobium sp.]